MALAMPINLANGRCCAYTLLLKDSTVGRQCRRKRSRRRPSTWLRTLGRRSRNYNSPTHCLPVTGTCSRTFIQNTSGPTKKMCSLHVQNSMYPNRVPDSSLTQSTNPPSVGRGLSVRPCLAAGWLNGSMDGRWDAGWSYS